MKNLKPVFRRKKQLLITMRQAFATKLNDADALLQAIPSKEIREKYSEILPHLGDKTEVLKDITTEVISELFDGMKVQMTTQSVFDKEVDTHYIDSEFSDLAMWEGTFSGRISKTYADVVANAENRFDALKTIINTKDGTTLTDSTYNLTSFDLVVAKMAKTLVDNTNATIVSNTLDKATIKSKSLLESFEYIEQTYQTIAERIETEHALSFDYETVNAPIPSDTTLKEIIEDGISINNQNEILVTAMNNNKQYFETQLKPRILTISDFFIEMHISDVKFINQGLEYIILLIKISNELARLQKIGFSILETQKKEMSDTLILLGVRDVEAVRD